MLMMFSALFIKSLNIAITILTYSAFTLSHSLSTKMDFSTIWNIQIHKVADIHEISHETKVIIKNKKEFPTVSLQNLNVVG